jgi:hypothetical protein
MLVTLASWLLQNGTGLISMLGTKSLFCYSSLLLLFRKVQVTTFMYKLYRHKLYREQIVSVQIVSHNLYRHNLYRTQIVSGHKLYRAQIVSCNKLYRGTNCIGPKLYRGTNCIGQKLLITKFLMMKFLSNKVPKLQNS